MAISFSFDLNIRDPQPRPILNDKPEINLVGIPGFKVAFLLLPCVQFFDHNFTARFPIQIGSEKKSPLLVLLCSHKKGCPVVSVAFHSDALRQRSKPILPRIARKIDTKPMTSANPF